MNFRTVFKLAKETVSEWDDDRAMSLAASLAFYTLLSIAPLLVVAVAVAGMVFGEDAARGEIVRQLEGVLGHQGGEAIQSILVSAKKPTAGITGTVVGVVVLLFGASGVFSELQAAMDTIWNVRPKPLGIFGFVKARLLSFAMVLGVAFLLLVSLLLSAALSAAGTFLGANLPGGETIWQVANFIISFAIITGLFALMFKVIPDVIVAWKDVFVGATITAFLFTIGKLLIGLYLGKASVGSPYGAAGSLVVLVVWIYYSTQILLLGAEATQVYARHCGTKITPNELAEAIETIPTPGAPEASNPAS